MSVLQEFSRFQSLRIPATWFIVHNNFMEMNPEELNVDDKKGWLYFTVDLLQVKHQVDDIILDVGWYPEGDPDGMYGLELIKNKNWHEPLETFDTRNKEKVVQAIEMLLLKVRTGYYA